MSAADMKCECTYVRSYILTIHYPLLKYMYNVHCAAAAAAAAVATDDNIITTMEGTTTQHRHHS